MSYSRILLNTELVALGCLAVCAAIFSLLFSNGRHAIFGLSDALLLFCIFGVLPVSGYGAPVYALLRYRGVAKWWSALLIGLFPGLIGIFPSLVAYSNDSILSRIAVFVLVVGGVIGLLTHLVIAGHASSLFKSKPLHCIAWIAGLLVLGGGANRYHQKKLHEQVLSDHAAIAAKFDTENAKLRNIVESEIEKVPLPAGSLLIYQEIKADRKCMTSEIKRLYVNELSPMDLCNAIDISLQKTGWELFEGCHNKPFKQNAGPSGNQNSFRYAARRPLGKYGLDLLAAPNDSWEGSSDISGVGQQKALPTAKQKGKPYFILTVSYIEDRQLFNQKCPDSDVRCDCVYGSFFARKFTGQPETISSH